MEQVISVVGSAVLAVVAVRHAQWGFILEGTWALVSASGLASLALVRWRLGSGAEAVGKN